MSIHCNIYIISAEVSVHVESRIYKIYVSDLIDFPVVVVIHTCYCNTRVEALPAVTYWTAVPACTDLVMSSHRDLKRDEHACSYSCRMLENPCWLY